jgi:hypothetical protein
MCSNLRLPQGAEVAAWRCSVQVQQPPLRGGVAARRYSCARRCSNLGDAFIWALLPARGLEGSSFRLALSQGFITAGSFTKLCAGERRRIEV